MNPNDHWLKPNWPVPGNVHAAMTLRTGGVSTGPYSSLNPATHVGDDPVSVHRNRAIIKEMLNLPSDPAWLNQVHSNVAVQAMPDAPTPQADAAYTDQPGIVCVVMTADCLPILICSEDGKEIAAIHAGWRGLANGIIDQTLAQLKSSNLLVWLGPAIGPENFEVGGEVRNAFIGKSPDYVSCFKNKDKENKWLADIYQLARVNLAALGVHNVYGGEYCTVADSEQFFSYRRDTVTGRMATLIWRN